MFFSLLLNAIPIEFLKLKRIKFTYRIVIVLVKHFANLIHWKPTKCSKNSQSLYELSPHRYRLVQAEYTFEERRMWQMTRYIHASCDCNCVSEYKCVSRLHHIKIHRHSVHVSIRFELIWGSVSFILHLKSLIIVLNFFFIIFGISLRKNK